MERSEHKLSGRTYPALIFNHTLELNLKWLITLSTPTSTIAKISAG